MLINQTHQTTENYIDFYLSKISSLFNNIISYPTLAFLSLSLLHSALEKQQLVLTINSYVNIWKQNNNWQFSSTFTFQFLQQKKNEKAKYSFISSEEEKKKIVLFSCWCWKRMIFFHWLIIDCRSEAIYIIEEEMNGRERSYTLAQ
jgi:hypothetical protein